MIDRREPGRTEPVEAIPGTYEEIPEVLEKGACVDIASAELELDDPDTVEHTLCVPENLKLVALGVQLEDVDPSCAGFP